MVSKTILSWYKAWIGRDYIADGCIHSQSWIDSRLLLRPYVPIVKLLYEGKSKSLCPYFITGKIRYIQRTKYIDIIPCTFHYFSTYSLCRFRHMSHRSTNFAMPLPYKSAVWLRNHCPTAALTLSSQVNRCPARNFFSGLKIWKSLGVRSGLYGGCSRNSHWNFRSLLTILFATCGLALSWRMNTLSTSRILRCLFLIKARRSDSVEQYLSALIVESRGMKSSTSGPRQSRNAVNITLWTDGTVLNFFFTGVCGCFHTILCCFDSGV